jgi:hypothetical protein
MFHNTAITRLGGGALSLLWKTRLGTRSESPVHTSPALLGTEDVGYQAFGVLEGDKLAVEVEEIVATALGEEDAVDDVDTEALIVALDDSATDTVGDALDDPLIDALGEPLEDTVDDPLGDVVPLKEPLSDGTDDLDEELD